jgi:MFS family permease
VYSCAFTFITNYGIGGLAPAFYVLHLELNRTMTETSHLLLWPILVLGLFNFFWVPLANYLGKRPVFVFASLLLLACYIWGALASSFKSLLWSNIIAAFAGSSTEALGAAIVSVSYGRYNFSYLVLGIAVGDNAVTKTLARICTTCTSEVLTWASTCQHAQLVSKHGSRVLTSDRNAIAGGNTIGPLVCGFVVQGLGWRWHKWIAAIFTAMNFIAVVLFVPETSHDRTSEAETGHGNVREVVPKEAEDATKAVQVGARDQSSSNSGIPSGISQLPRKTFIQELSLWNGTPRTNLFEMFIRYVPYDHLGERVDRGLTRLDLFR